MFVKSGWKNNMFSILTKRRLGYKWLSPNFPANKTIHYYLTLRGFTTEGEVCELAD